MTRAPLPGKLRVEGTGNAEIDRLITVAMFCTRAKIVAARDELEAAIRKVVTERDAYRDAYTGSRPLPEEDRT